MHTFQQMIKESIRGALRQMRLEDADIEITVLYSDKPSHGDYASSVAMTLAKRRKEPLMELAQALQAVLSQDALYERVEAVKPGFLNFFLSQQALIDCLGSAFQNPQAFTHSSLAGERILLEYISANPTGPLHVGHARWAALGDSLARIFEACGAEVWREFYVNDAGNQIHLLNESVRAIQEGRPVPEDGYHGAYMYEVAKIPGDPKENLRKLQEESLERFQVKMDAWFSEKSLYDQGLVEQALKELRAGNYLYESEGALWCRTTAFGDDKDRVILKQDGEYTYFASDVAYHRDKVLRKNGYYHRLMTLLGTDHHGYVKRLQSIVEIFSALYQKDTSLEVPIGQFVNLLRNGEPVRMSKRTGDLITLDDVLEEIGSDAMRYGLLRPRMDSMVNFDLADAVKQSEDNPVFYVQYAHARICAILRKAQAEGLAPNLTCLSAWEGNVTLEERMLILTLSRVPETLAEAAKHLEIHRIPMVLELIATRFHRFYAKCRVMNAEAPAVTQQRLLMVACVQGALSFGLGLLGVSAPERMAKTPSAMPSAMPSA